MPTCLIYHGEPTGAMGSLQLGSGRSSPTLPKKSTARLVQALTSVCHISGLCGFGRRYRDIRRDRSQRGMGLGHHNFGDAPEAKARNRVASRTFTTEMHS